MSDIDRRREAGALRGTVERREYAAVGLECRMADDGGAIRLGGYASITGVPYQVGPFEEIVQPGAFKRTLSEQPKVSLLINHSGLPMASTGTSTLRLEEDQKGLRWEADLDPEDETSVALARKVRRGLITDASMAFMVTADDWNADRSKRTIKSLSLNRGDISCVNEGANPHASTAMRALERAEADAFWSKFKTDGEWLEAQRNRLRTLQVAEVSRGRTAEQRIAAEARRQAIMRGGRPDALQLARERLAKIRRVA